MEPQTRKGTLEGTLGPRPLKQTLQKEPKSRADGGLAALVPLPGTPRPGPQVGLGSF